MKIINHKPKRRPTPRRGDIWQPKDAAHHSVIVADTTPDRVYLQYVDSPEFSFTMDLATFLRYYTFDRRVRLTRPEQVGYVQPFFA